MNAERLRAVRRALAIVLHHEARQVTLQGTREYHMSGMKHKVKPSDTIRTTVVYERNGGIRWGSRISSIYEFLSYQEPNRIHMLAEAIAHANGGSFAGSGLIGEVEAREIDPSEEELQWAEQVLLPFNIPRTAGKYSAQYKVNATFYITLTGEYNNATVAESLLRGKAYQNQHMWRPGEDLSQSVIDTVSIEKVS